MLTTRPFDAAPGADTGVPRTLTVRHRAPLPVLVKRLSASLPTAQRQLAEAYLQRSQIYLQKGDVNAAATALSRARTLMPKAPALTSGVNSAIAHARKAELDKAEAALKAAEKRPPAKVIDPAAESTTVALNITDIKKLRHQLDLIAQDIVNYQCAVTLQVPRTADYPWLATLITKRVKKLNPGFDFKLDRHIVRHVPAQMVLIPSKP